MAKRKIGKKVGSVLDQPGRVASAAMRAGVGSIAGQVVGGMAGGSYNKSAGAVGASIGGIYGAAAGARSGWNAHPNTRNAKTAVRTAKPAPAKTQSRVPRKGR